MAAPSRTFEDIIKAEPSCVQGEPVVVFSSWGAAFQISAIRSNQINLAVHLDERVLHRKRSPVPSTTGVSPPRPRTTVPLDGPSAIPSHLTNEFAPSPAWPTREWPGILPRMVKKLERIEMAQLAVSSILFKSLCRERISTEGIPLAELRPLCDPIRPSTTILSGPLARIRYVAFRHQSDPS